MKLLRVDTSGRQVTTVLPAVWPGGWDVTTRGIVFLSGGSAVVADGGQASTVDLYDVTIGRTRTIGTLPFPVTPPGYNPPRVLAASPDGRWLVVSHMDHWERDVMVADNYR